MHTLNPLRLFVWDKTLKSLDEIACLLQCNFCKKPLEKPVAIERCGHNYCDSCVDEIKGKCLICGVTFMRSEAKLDSLTTDLLSASLELRTLLETANHTEPPSVLSCGENAPATSCQTDKTGAKNSGRKRKANETRGAGKKEKVSDSVKVATLVSSPSAEKTKANASLSSSVCAALEVNRRNAKGETSLHIACIKGNAEKVKALLESGATPHTKDNAGWTPLHETCHHGHLEIAKLLLSYGAHVDVPGCNNETPLHDAVKTGNIELIELLRKWGAKDDSRDLFGHTSRDYAAECQDPNIINKALDTPSQSKVCKMKYTTASKKIVVIGSGLPDDWSKKLEKFAKTLKCKFVQDFSLEVTHVIVYCEAGMACQRTKNLMMGVASGKALVIQEWIDECLKKNSFVPHENFFIKGFSFEPSCKSPSSSYKNVMDLNPSIFNGCHMFIHGSKFDTFTKKELEAIIKCGDGLILTREPNPESIPKCERTVPFHASPSGSLARCSHYIIYEEGLSEPLIKYDMEHVKSLPYSWIIKCLDTFSFDICNRLT